jgi:hypothetical protein
MTVAGAKLSLPRLSQGIKDPTLARAVRALEDKVSELDVRLTDAERRLKAGGL